MNNLIKDMNNLIKDMNNLIKDVNKLIIRILKYSARHKNASTLELSNQSSDILVINSEFTQKGMTPRF